ncbi:MAG: TolC family protein [Sphingobacteriia bacterium]|nr:TolC family protein [Sphingobacteriia bacterium]
MRKFFKTIIYITLTTISVTSVAQETTILTYKEYMTRVKSANISYLAEKYNVDIAEAKMQAAKIMPDPEISIGYGNNQDWDLQMGYNIDAGLSYTLELGGKRGARMGVARSEKELAEVLLEDYFRNLRADATIAYLSAVKQRHLYQLQKSSYREMYQLAQADSLRFKAGTIMEVDARQSKLEAQSMRNEIYAYESDLKETLLNLLMLQGINTLQLPDSIQGSLLLPKQDFDLAKLISLAQNNRTDIQMAIKTQEMSQNNLRLTKANRYIDLGLSIGGSYSSEVRNELAPAPAFKGIVAGISVPLKFSNINKGELKAAQLTVSQSKMQYEAIELQIRTEVAQAYSRYISALRQVEQFDNGLLSEAEYIFKKKVYSYERGESNMIELLNAKRTYYDNQIAYQESLFNFSVALIELERACGVWDIEIK